MARVALELVGFTLLALFVLLLLLSAGQVAQVADLVAGSESLFGLAGLLLLVLLEAALPLAGLVASGWVYGRQRADGLLLARAALGHSGLRTHGPALALGAALGLSAAWLAHAPVPKAVDTLRGRVVGAAADALLAGGGSAPLPGGGAVHRSAEGVWAALPSAGAPVLVRARSARAERVEGAWRLRLDDFFAWGGAARMRAGHATVELPDRTLERRLGMLGPPNALSSATLPADAHGRFTWHRRLALPAMAPLWCLLGALLGGALGGVGALLVATGAVSAALWLLRTGELTARAGMLSPALAAWAPALLLLLGLALLAPRLLRRLDA